MLQKILFLYTFINTQIFAQSNNEKIISLAPSLTEFVYEFKLEKRLVGVTNQCDYPNNVNAKIKIGDYINPNIESIIKSEAKIILASEGNPRDILEKLKQNSFKVFEFNLHNIDNLSIEVTKLAKFLQVENEAILFNAKLEKLLTNLKNKKNISNNKYFMALQFDPLYSLTSETWLGDLFSKAGFKNIVPNNKIKYPQIAQEFLLLNKPHIIFSDPMSIKNEEELKKQINQIFGVSIAKDIKKIILPKDILMRPGPRIIEGIKYLLTL